MTKRCTINRQFRVEFDGTDDDFIRTADELSFRHLGEYLDSLDLGDAIGAILRIASKSDAMLWSFKDDNIDIQVEFDDDLYRWGE